MDKIEKATADLEAAVTAVQQSTADPRMTTDALVTAVKAVIADIKPEAKAPKKSK
jgi:hypothetical protein